MIDLKNITFGYDDKRRVLSNICIEVKKHSTLAIVGCSGCGKSTLLRIIAGLLPDECGRHYFNGNILIDGMKPQDFMRSGRLGFVFQEATLMPNLTVQQNIIFPLRFLKASENAEIINNCIDMVGLSSFKDKFPFQLSGGMRTRVSLARAFITSPKLLLLDEPFSSLDVKWKNRLYRELNLLKERNKSTVIIVTHDIEEAMILADTIAVIGDNGEIISVIDCSEGDEKFVGSNLYMKIRNLLIK